MTREVAEGYHARGWVPIPIPLGEKAPAFYRWQHATLDDALARFGDAETNVGVLLGDASGGLVDIDLDCAEAVELAGAFLPASATFGRASRQRSHRLFVAVGCPTEKYVYDTGEKNEKGAPIRETLLEVRANGGLHTIFPPSVHPSGEVIAFEGEGEPAPITIAVDDLLQRARGLAAASLLVRHGFARDVAVRAVVDCDAAIVEGLPDRVANPVRQWLGLEQSAPAAPVRVVNAERAADFDAAAAKWNADHPREYPRHTAECPVCGDAGSFGRLPSDATRWYCFSTDHPDGVGVRGQQGFHGDALDLAAAERGVRPVDVLVRDGYLAPKQPTRRPRAAQRSQSGGAAAEPAEAQAPQPRAEGQARRALYNRSYLTAVTILEGNLRDVLEGRDLRLNEMTGKVEVGGAQLREVDVGRIRANIERNFAGSVDKDGNEKGLQLGKDDLFAAVEHVASARPYHPVREYLSGLEWDGVERIDAAVEDILGAPRTSLNMAMLRRFFVAAVARAMRPGCKVDTVLVLVGAQGRFKSSFFRVLATPWFVDSAVDIHNKDSFQILRNAWIYEWAELEALRRARDANAYKAFLSSAVDTYRPSHARLVVDVPRSCVIVGSTNDEFLTDSTGNRRFHPITVGTIDVDLVERQRNQLWAEAVTLFRAGEQWWLTPDEERDLVVIQADHVVSEPWEGPVLRWLSVRREPFPISAVFEQALEKPKGQWTSGDARKIAAILREAGWEQDEGKKKRGQIRLWHEKPRMDPG